jgi:uncharacterized protein DUF5989
MDLLRDMIGYIRQRRRWWLVPVIILLLYVGVLLVFSAASPIAPLLYTLF